MTRQCSELPRLVRKGLKLDFDGLDFGKIKPSSNIITVHEILGNAFHREKRKDRKSTVDLAGEEDIDYLAVAAKIMQIFIIGANAEISVASFDVITATRVLARLTDADTR